MLLQGKDVELPQLQAELVAAGIEVPALGTHGDRLHTYDEDGAIVDLPPGAAAVVAAHEPVPPEPVPTPAERFDAVIDAARETLAGANTVNQVKAAVSDVLGGLQEIYGTGGTS
jgi:hypothetical protein